MTPTLVPLLLSLVAATQEEGLERSELVCRWAMAGEARELARALREDASLAGARDSRGRPALFLATIFPQEKKEETVQLLLDAGADPNATWEPIAWAPLHAAAEYATPEVVRALLAHGAAIDAARTDGDTALILAALHGRIDNVVALLEAGAAIDARNAEGSTALHRALGNKKWEVVDVLLRHEPSLDLVDDDWGAPLALAAFHGEARLVERLLAAGASVNPPFSIRGFTPLMSAARAGHAEIARLLLERGADPDAIGAARYGEGAIHLAGREASLPLLDALIAHGADVNLLNSEGHTPLALTQDAAARSLLETHGALERLPAVDLGELELEVWRLASWGERRYRFQRLPRHGSGEKEPSEAGTIVLATEVSATGVTLRDTYDLHAGARRVSAVVTTRCRANDWLSPTRIECAGDGGEMPSFTATVAGSQATVRTAEGTQQRELPADTVTLEALLRIVALLPRAKGTRVALPHVLETGEWGLREGYVVTSLGPELVGAGEGALPCTKFAVDRSYGRAMVLWVDAGGIVQRMLVDGDKLAELIP